MSSVEKNKIKKTLKQGSGNQWMKYCGAALFFVGGGYFLFQQTKSRNEREQSTTLNDTPIDMIKESLDDNITVEKLCFLCI